MVDKIAAIKKNSTGRSVDLLKTNEMLLLFRKLSSVIIIRLNIIKNEPVIYNALIFTRSTGFSKNKVNESGTLIMSRTKK